MVTQKRDKGQHCSRKLKTRAGRPYDMQLLLYGDAQSFWSVIM